MKLVALLTFSLSLHPLFHLPSDLRPDLRIACELWDLHNEPLCSEDMANPLVSIKLYCSFKWIVCEYTILSIFCVLSGNL